MNTQIAELFKTAVRERDIASLTKAIEAMATTSHTIDLNISDGDETIASRLADVVAQTTDDILSLRLRLAPEFHKLTLGNKEHQRILSMLIGHPVICRDKVQCEALLKHVPANVINPILAFNLACAAAHHKDREALLKYTKRALELNKSPEQFRQDADFVPYLSDKKFIALLNRKYESSAEREYRVQRRIRRQIKMYPVTNVLRQVFSLKVIVAVAICVAILSPLLALVDRSMQSGDLGFQTMLIANALFVAMGVPVVAAGMHLYVRLEPQLPFGGIFILGVLTIGVLSLIKNQLYVHYSVDFARPELMAVLSASLPVLPIIIGYIVLIVALRGGPHH
jgi:hypothetical protein